MILRRWRFVAVATLVVLLVSACYRYIAEFNFNQDRSGTVTFSQTFGPSVMNEGSTAEYETPEEACTVIGEAIRDVDLGLRVTHFESISEADGSCAVSVSGEFDSAQDFAESDIEFTEMDSGWQVTVPIADDIQSAEFRHDLSSVSAEDVYFRVAVRLPGTPTSNHNAQRVENDQFIWEATGADLQDLPTELRASSRKVAGNSSTRLETAIQPREVVVGSDSARFETAIQPEEPEMTDSAAGSNYTWIVLVVVGSIMLLGVLYVVQNRRETLGATDPDDDTTPPVSFATKSSSWPSALLCSHQ